MYFLVMRPIVWEKSPKNWEFQYMVDTELVVMQKQQQNCSRSFLIKIQKVWKHLFKTISIRNCFILIWTWRLWRKSLINLEFTSCIMMLTSLFTLGRANTFENELISI